MIYKLRKKFILISAISIFSVVAIIFALITIFNILSLDRTMDMIADNIFLGGGRFPDSFENRFPKPDEKGKDKPVFDFINPETPFATRHFSVWFDSDNKIKKVNTEYVHSVNDTTAKEMATEAIADGNSGWISGYRYKIYTQNSTRVAVFVNGTSNLASLYQTILISAIVLLGCALLVLLLIILFSKKVVKPVAQSYEKQKEFITNANHELKTPLTLILANLDIAEAELGKNEWLSDIRSVGNRMTELVNQLVELTRADEEKTALSRSEFNIGEAVLDAVSEFEPLITARKKSIDTEIDATLTCFGDETLIRRLIGILMDNAVKYCDEGGFIHVALYTQRKKAVLVVENTYRDVDLLELDKVFDRFWRADKARSFHGGYGIGLSMAKAIVQKHNGSITAYKKSPDKIGFKAVF